MLVNNIDECLKLALDQVSEWLKSQNLPHLLNMIKNIPERISYDILSLRDTGENTDHFIEYRVEKGQWSLELAEELRKTLLNQVNTPYDLVQELYCSLYAFSCLNKAEDLSLHFPRKVRTADIGCGMLVTSKPLLISILRNKKAHISFIDNNSTNKTALLIVDQIVNFLGIQDQIEIFETSGDEILVEDEIYDLLWIKYAFHEFSYVLRNKKWKILQNNATIFPNELEDIKNELLPFLDEIYRINEPKGQIIFEDHTLGDYDLKFVRSLFRHYWKNLKGQTLSSEDFQIQASIKRRAR
ncbi:MAG: hypothetical protein ACFFDT_28165 [Candidatus Hodarchaeota archaeon]